MSAEKFKSNLVKSQTAEPNDKSHTVKVHENEVIDSRKTCISTPPIQNNSHVIKLNDKISQEYAKNQTVKNTGSSKNVESSVRSPEVQNVTSFGFTQSNCEVEKNVENSKTNFTVTKKCEEVSNLKKMRNLFSEGNFVNYCLHIPQGTKSPPSTVCSSKLLRKSTFEAPEFSCMKSPLSPRREDTLNENYSSSFEFSNRVPKSSILNPPKLSFDSAHQRTPEHQNTNNRTSVPQEGGLVTPSASKGTPYPQASSLFGSSSWKIPSDSKNVMLALNAKGRTSHPQESSNEHIFGNVFRKRKASTNFQEDEKLGGPESQKKPLKNSKLSGNIEELQKSKINNNSIPENKGVNNFSLFKTAHSLTFDTPTFSEGPRDINSNSDRPLNVSDKDKNKKTEEPTMKSNNKADDLKGTGMENCKIYEWKNCGSNSDNQEAESLWETRKNKSGKQHLTTLKTIKVDTGNEMYNKGMPDQNSDQNVRNENSTDGLRMETLCENDDQQFGSLNASLHCQKPSKTYQIKNNQQFNNTSEIAFEKMKNTPGKSTILVKDTVSRKRKLYNYTLESSPTSSQSPQKISNKGGKPTTNNIKEAERSDIPLTTGRKKSLRLKKVSKYTYASSDDDISDLDFIDDPSKVEPTRKLSKRKKTVPKVLAQNKPTKLIRRSQKTSEIQAHCVSISPEVSTKSPPVDLLREKSPCELVVEEVPIEERKSDHCSLELQRPPLRLLTESSDSDHTLILNAPSRRDSLGTHLLYTYFIVYRLMDVEN